MNDLKNDNSRRFVITLLLSGIFLGLAIFTKIPAFTMVLFVGFLVFTNNKNSFKILSMWLIPVILIPMIWPVYAISIGHLNDWLRGVYYQTHREAQTFFASLNLFFKTDPVLFMVGTAGLVFAAIRRDYFLLLCAIPFLMALYFLGWVMIYHFILLLPVLCIAGARLLLEIPNRIRFKSIARISLSAIVVIGILIFGVTTTFLLIRSNTNSFYFEGALFLTQYLEDNNVSFKKNNLTIISDAFYLWMPQLVFHLPGTYKTFFDNTLSRTQLSLLIVDAGFMHVMHDHSKQGNFLYSIYDTNNTKKIAMFGENQYSSQNISIYLYRPKASNSH